MKNWLLKKKGINSLKHCYFCYSWQINNKWLFFGENLGDWKENLKNYLKEFFYWENVKDNKVCNANIIDLEFGELKYGKKSKLNVLIEDKNYENVLVFDLDIETTICNHCKKSQGTYHEAVIQFRSVPQNIIREFSEELIKKEVFTKGVLEKDGGIDVKVTDKKAARSIAKNLANKHNLDYKLTSKLITYNHEKGKEVYRDFILLKPKVLDNFVYYKGEFWKVENNKLRNLKSGEKIEIPKDKDYLEKVDVEELEKISEDKEGSYFMDKEYNTYYFKAKKAVKLKKSTEEFFYLED